MAWLDNLALRSKVMVPLLMMAALIIAMVGLGAEKLLTVSGASQKIIGHASPALLMQTKASQAIQRLGYDVYRTLSYQTGTPEEDEAQKDFDLTAKDVKSFFQQARDAYPEKAADFAGFAARFDAILIEQKAQEKIAATTNGFTLGTKDTPDDINLSAEIARRQIAMDRRLDILSKDIVRFSDALEAQNNAASQALQSSATAAVWTMIGLGAASVLGGCAVALWIATTRIAAPLRRLTDQMGRLAQGDLQAVIDAQGRRDEVGLMARAVQVFKNNGLRARALENDAERLRGDAEAQRRLGETERRNTEREQTALVEALAASLRRLAAGDLTARIEAHFEGRYLQIKTDFNAAVASLSEAMGAISVFTGSIRGGSDEIAQASDDLARRTEHQAASLEQTAAALDQITATVGRSASGAKKAASALSGAQSHADQAGAVMDQAVSAIGVIEHSSGQIGQIIGVIDAIAFQTNLLALNAGVEAARAGDAGRGFAVVASEVRALAQRSAAAAKEIKDLVGNSTLQVERGVRLVGDTGRALTAVVSKMGEINMLVAEIANSSHEQAAGLSQVNTAVNQMDEVTQRNAAMVEQATAAAATLRSEAGQLARMVARFRTDERTAA